MRFDYSDFHSEEITVRREWYKNPHCEYGGGSRLTRLRGSKEVMQRKHKPQYCLFQDIVERYLRRYKPTILTLDEWNELRHALSAHFSKKWGYSNAYTHILSWPRSNPANRNVHDVIVNGVRVEDTVPEQRRTIALLHTVIDLLDA